MYQVPQYVHNHNKNEDDLSLKIDNSFGPWCNHLLFIICSLTFQNSWLHQIFTNKYFQWLCIYDIFTFLKWLIIYQPITTVLNYSEYFWLLLFVSLQNSYWCRSFWRRWDRLWMHLLYDFSCFWSWSLKWLPATSFWHFCSLKNILISCQQWSRHVNFKVNIVITQFGSHV